MVESVTKVMASTKRKTEANSEDSGQGPAKKKKVQGKFPTFGNNPKGKFLKNSVAGAIKEDGKPDWGKVKQKQKETTEQLRHKNRNEYETIKQALRLWEKLRSRKTKQEDKKGVLDELSKLLKGKLKEVIRTHDTSRVIQAMMRQGEERIQKELVDELLPQVVAMAQCKYSTHTVRAMLKHCPSALRRAIIDQALGHVVSLASNKLSTPILEEAYSKHASAQQRIFIRQELYGDLYKSCHNLNVTSLSTAFQQNPGMKGAILKSVKGILEKLTGKKESLRLALVQEVLFDYLGVCEAEDKAEMMDALKGELDCLLRGKDGSKVAQMVLWNSSTKEKKAFVKEIKEELVELCLNEHASNVLLGLIDCVDDTVLLGKALIPILVENAKTIVQDEHGRKVLLYLLAHRDPAYFHPTEVAHLAQADSSPFVKKPSQTRIPELQSYLVPGLLAQVEDSPLDWLYPSQIALFTLALVKGSAASPQLGSCLGSLAAALTSPKSRLGPEATPAHEHSAVHLMLKKLIAHDKTVSEPSARLSEALLDKLSDDTISSWLSTNRGCFIFVFILEAELDPASTRLRSKLSKFTSVLNKQNSKGAEILKKLVNS